MRFLSMRQHSGLAMLLVALLTACQPKAISMTPEETQRVEAITADMTTRCVGRYLIDMPQSFVLNSESTTVIEGVKVAVRPMDRQLFELTLAGRLAELEGTKFRGSLREFPFIRARNPLPSPFIGVLIDRARSINEGRLGRTLEALGWKDGYEIKAHINAIDNTFPEDANDSIAKQLGNDTPEKLAHLLKVYELVSGRKDTEIPSVPGLCIPNGFVVGADREGQDTDAVYHLADAPDVWFGFGSSDAIKEDSTLLQRSPSAEKAMAKEDAKLLRKGTRTIHGQEYEEVLMGNTLEQDGIRGSMFMMYGNELRSDPLQPFVDLGFRNGNRIPVPELTMAEKDKLRLNEILTKATLTDSEAVAIWDKVSATLRPRPGAF